MMALRVAAAVFLLLTVPSFTAAAKVPITACLSTALGNAAMGIGYVPSYWTYNNLAVTSQFVGSPDGSARGVARAMAANGSDCDVYFGPLTSQMTQAVNALVNCVWMASTVMGTEFNDRTSYPYFSRVMPGADVLQGGIAKIMIAMKWTTVSVLCTDNAYGQAVASGLATYLRTVGGETITQCVSVSADYTTVEKVVLAAMASKTRVLYIASLSTEAAYIQGRLAVLNNKAASKLIIIFSELMFGSNWADVPGAITPYFGYDPSYNAFMDATLTRNTTDEQRQYAALGLKYTSAVPRSGATALSIDGGRLVFGAFDDYIAKYGSLPSSLALRLQIVRNYTLMNAFTSTNLTLPNGIRPTPTPMVIYNAGSNGTYTIVANLTTDMNISWAPSLYLMGQTYALADVPPAIDPVQPASPAPAYWIIGVVAGVLLILALPVAHHVRQQMLLAVRPTDATKPFAVMFVGVKNLGEVQDLGPENTAAALTRVTAEVRKAVRRHGCYEARRVDESTVMVVSKELPNALRCASAITEAILDINWTSVTNRAPNAPTRRRDGSSDGSRSVSTRLSRNTHHNTVRVSSRADDQSTAARTKRSAATVLSTSVNEPSRPALNIGVHYGFGLIDVDEALNTVSYVGGAVSRAAVVADAAGRDQILVSKEVREFMEDTKDSLGAFDDVEGWQTVAPDTFAFLPSGMTNERVELQVERMKRHVVAVSKGLGGTEASGTIAAALQQAEAGMAQKRIGVAVIRVPFLQEAVSDAAAVSRASDILEDIAEVASWHRGEVHSIQVDRVTILVNASIPSAQPVPKAALIALGVVDAIRAMGLPCTAGVSGGPALVGQCVKSAGTSAIGRPIANATVAEEFASRYGLGVCVQDSGNGVADLDSRLHTLTVGALEQPSGGMMRVVAVIAERDTTGGEWLYAMTSGNAALVANEAAWNSVLEKKRPEAEVLAAVHSPPEQALDEPTAAALAVSIPQLEQAIARLAL